LLMLRKEQKEAGVLSETKYTRTRVALPRDHQTLTQPFYFHFFSKWELYPDILFAFSTALVIQPQIHREDLPKPPKEMLKYQHKEGFFAAMKLELGNITKRKTYDIADRPTIRICQ